MSEPTSDDPPAYLAQYRFSQKIACPRTGSIVSFADIGEGSGVPLLWMMPSGGSRWFAAAHDPMCRRYGVRMIVVDRPGIGATPVVPLDQRIQVSCLHTVSVLEHLRIKPAHLLAASAGIYYALYLLTHHAESFANGLKIPPHVYFISPWSPLLPADSPDYYPSYFTWIPTPLISTQHYTVCHLFYSYSFGSTLKICPQLQKRNILIPQLPGLMKAGQQAATVWTNGQKVWSAARSWMKGWTTPETSTSVNGDTKSTSEGKGIEHDQKTIEKEAADIPAHIPGESPMDMVNVDNESEVKVDGEEEPRKPLWGPCECCISCLVTEYFNHENFEGVGQDHLICLNRLNANTGPEWIENIFNDLDKSVATAQSSTSTLHEADMQVDQKDGGRMPERRIPLNVWWGWHDLMVPRPGQCWLNKVLSRHESLDLTVYNIEDGDHNDLLARRDGIYMVYDMVSSLGGGLAIPRMPV